MKLYVAGQYSARETARKVMDMFEKHGHEITYDWTGDQDEGIFQLGQHKLVALGEFAAVGMAEAFILVVPHNGGGCGCFLEMGMAIGLGKPCYLVDEVYWSVDDPWPNHDNPTKPTQCLTLAKPVWSWANLEEPK